MKNITERQLEVLKYIEKFIRDNGFAPSNRDIQAQFSFNSTNAMTSHLKGLVDKGYIRHAPGIARSIVVLKPSSSVVVLKPQSWNSVGIGLKPRSVAKAASPRMALTVSSNSKFPRLK